MPDTYSSLLDYETHTSVIVPGAVAGATVYVTGPATAAQGAPVSPAPSAAGRVADLTFPASQYGTMIPQAWGTTRVKGTVIWATKPVESYAYEMTANPTPTVPGSAVFSNVPVYTISLAVAYARGPQGTPKRVWAGDVLLWDAGTTAYDLTFYPGSATQQPDPTIVADRGRANTPAFRGMAYFVLKNVDLAPWGNAIPAFSVETNAPTAAPPSHFPHGTDTQLAFLRGHDLYVGSGTEVLGTGTGDDSFIYPLDPTYAGDSVLHRPVKVASGVACYAIASYVSVMYADAAGNLFFAGDDGGGSYPHSVTGAGIGSYPTWQACGNYGAVAQLATFSGVAYFRLMADGTLWFRGSTGSSSAPGPLPYVRGDGSSAGADAWVQVASGAASVFAGETFSAYVGTDGHLYVTGTNTGGRLGTGGTSDVTSWTDVLSGVAHCEGDQHGLLALKADGTVWAAGVNTWNVFGDAALGTSYSSSSWAQVPGLSGVTQVAVCAGAYFALTASGDVYSWGSNSDNCEVGRGTAHGLYDPAVILSGAVEVAPGLAGGLAVKPDGQVYGWGATGNLPPPFPASFNTHALGTDDAGAYPTPTLLPWGAGASGASGATLGGILADLAEQTGLAPGDLDFSAANQPVTGFALTSQRAARDVMAELTGLYLTDLTEPGGTLTAVKRGGASSLTLAYDDLGAELEPGHNEPKARLAASRVQDVELPRLLTLNYTSKAKGYDSAAANAIKLTSADVDNLTSVSTAVVLSETQAAQTAKALLVSAWSERETYTFSLPPRFLGVCPADVLTVTLRDGAARRLRVTQADAALWGPLAVQAVRDDADALTQSLGGAALGATFYALLDPFTTTLTAYSGNGLNDTDAASAGVYLAATGGAGWGGCTVYLSRDGGATFNPVATFSGGSVLGLTASALPAGTVGTALPEPSQSLTVTVGRGALSPHSLLEVLNGDNLALVSSGRGGGEYVRFTGALLLDSGAGAYRLTGLLRGQRGTPAISHAVGETFCLLTPGAYRRVIVGDDLLGQSVRVKAVPTGKDPATVGAFPMTLTGDEYRCYSPVGLTGTRAAGAGSDLTIQWVRRTRIGGEMTDGGDVPLSETGELYTARILNGSGAVIRTFGGLTSPTVTYTSGQQAADGFAAGSPIRVSVVQMGRTHPGNTTGEGYPATATF